MLANSQRQYKSALTHLPSFPQGLFLHNLLRYLEPGGPVPPSLLPPLLNVLRRVALDNPLVEAGEMLVPDVFLQQVLVGSVATAVNTTGGVLAQMLPVLRLPSHPSLADIAVVNLLALLGRQHAQPGGLKLRVTGQPPDLGITIIN